MEKLSKRESETLGLIAKGYTNQEIAEIMFISYHTVVCHSRSIKEKLNASNIPSAVYIAAKEGVI